MRHWVHYLAAAAWGLATPALMAMGAQAILEYFTSGKERMGHSTPVEFLFLFVIVGGLCFGAFLLADLLSAALFLPENGKRTRHFFLALLLYVFAGVGCFLLFMFCGTWIDALFS